jgi:hypothetical protein
MLDRETNKTNRISKSIFVFHFFNKKREEEVRPSKLILHFCIFLMQKSAFEMVKGIIINN